jgi:hypothetical protein
LTRAAAPRVHPADRAVRTGDRSHPDAAAVLTAFAAYHAGDDAAARAALQLVPLSSAFLDWKLLVRGLLADAVGDDDRAAENWKRLDPARLPARLAAAVAAARNPNGATPTAARHGRKLVGGAVLDGLTRLRGLVTRGRSLAPAFAAAEAVLPTLDAEAPHLRPRLAAALYRAIRDGGDRTDLPRHLAVFGPPADDPEFHKLEALAYEDCRRGDEAARHWLAYERWLATSPPGWPPAVRDRARAVALHRAAGQGKPSAAAGLLDRAAELAPDWDAPAAALFDLHAKAGNVADAEAVARRLLARRPDHLPTLTGLADLYDTARRPLDLLAVRMQAVGLNPLDADIRRAAANAVVRAARWQVAAGDWPSAVRTLGAVRAVGEDVAPPGLFVLRAMLALKSGNPAGAAADLERAAEDPADRLGVALTAAVDAGLVKLKPAERKRAADALVGLLAGPVRPVEALRLAQAFDRLTADGVTYRGKLAHAKAVEAAVLASGPGDPAEFEGLGLGLAAGRRWKLVGKLAPALRRRFPASPVFPLLEVEAVAADGRGIPARLLPPLREARRLAEASKDLRHRALLDRIAALEEQAEPYNLFRHLFGDD